MATDSEKLEAILQALTAARAGADSETSGIPSGAAFGLLIGNFEEQQAKLVSAADGIAREVFSRVFKRAAEHASAACVTGQPCPPEDPCKHCWARATLEGLEAGV